MKKVTHPVALRAAWPRAILSSFCLLSSSYLLLPPLAAQSASRVIDGAAVQPGGIAGALVLGNRPIAGVSVMIRETGQTTVTDKLGTYRFTNVTPGAYTLVATAPGYQKLHITDVVVKPNKNLTLNQVQLREVSESVTVLEPYVVKGEANNTLQLEEYMVEGKRITPFQDANVDIPRTINDARPYYIFDSKAIDRSGVTDLEAFLKKNVTMNAVFQSANQQAGGDLSGFDGTLVAGVYSAVDLRGLGANKTLVLINGRHVPGISLPGNGGQPDLNGIPLSAIDRVEILPSSASGIYGGGAIGGVVNVVLKQSYHGGELRLTYANQFDTDAGQRRVDLSYGLGLEGGRTQVTLSGSWSDQNLMLFQDRLDDYNRNRATAAANAPDYLPSGAVIPVLGALPNIKNRAAGNLTFKAGYGGGSLGSPITYVPAGTSPTTSISDLVAGLVANAGTWDLNNPPTIQYPNGLLRPMGSAASTRAFRGSIRRQMLPTVEMFAEYSWNENEAESQQNPFSVNAVALAASSAANPFNQSIWISIPSTYTAPAFSRSTATAVTFGSVAKLPADWVSSFDYTWSKTTYRDIKRNLQFSGSFSGSGLNPFVDTLMYPLPINYDLQVGTDVQDRVSYLDNFALRGSGPLWALPWGVPTLTAGIDFQLSTQPQTENALTIPDANVFGQLDETLTTYYKREQTTCSGYAELTMPLIKADYLPLVAALELQLTGRIDNYTQDTGTDGFVLYPNRPVFLDDGSINPDRRYFLGDTDATGTPYFDTVKYSARNYSFGLKYQPVKELTFRVSRGTAFVPPSPIDLLRRTEPDPSLTTVIDPQTQEAVDVQTISGGNPNLKPENSESFNAGVIWEPTWKPLKGLRLNAEYYQIKQFNAIGALSAQQIVDRYPDRVTRDPSGQIILVDVSSVNLLEKDTEGWDLTASYQRQTPYGFFSLSATQTITRHLLSQYDESQPPVDSVNFPSEGGAVRYRTNVMLNWEWSRWSAGWTARYISAYKQYGAEGGPAYTIFGGAFNNDLYVRAQGSDTISSQIYHDVMLAYAFGPRKAKSDSGAARVGASLLSDLSLQVVVTNVFDREPTFDAFNRAYFTSYFSDGMRRYSLALRKQF